MGTIEGNASRFYERMNKKDPTLLSVSGVTFLDSAQQNLSLRQTFFGELAVNFLPLVYRILVMCS